MCVCMYVCIYACMYVCMCKHIVNFFGRDYTAHTLLHDY